MLCLLTLWGLKEVLSSSGTWAKSHMRLDAESGYCLPLAFTLFLVGQGAGWVWLEGERYKSWKNSLKSFEHGGSTVFLIFLKSFLCFTLGNILYGETRKPWDKSKAIWRHTDHASTATRMWESFGTVANSLTTATFTFLGLDADSWMKCLSCPCWMEMLTGSLGISF